MDYIHIKKLEDYHPGYKDRTLIWCKTYFTMLNSDYEYENLDDIDKWRLVALIMLELQMQKPIPYDEKWLAKKITINKKPISLTIKMLHNFLEVVTEKDEVRNNSVTQSRVEKSRVEEISSIVEDLNKVCGSSYKPHTEKTIASVRARLNEGFTVENFKRVHRTMFKKWGKDPKMAQYLRPETLYSPKFESYLNMLEPKGVDRVWNS